jgi:peptidoglycan hydrolase-like protein with peptidoglycan-binding domain
MLSGVRFDVLQDLAAPERDLASVVLWKKSLSRSRQRRRLSEVGRKARRRRKSASLATTAALAAVPVIPQTVAAADLSGSNAAAAGAVHVDPAALSAAAQRVVLQEGSEGALVTALQTRLNDVLPVTHIAVDGIFGPQTRGAVIDFQRQADLPVTGIVDARSWAVLFKAPVVVFGGDSTGGSAGPGTTSSSSAGGESAVGNVSHSSRARAAGGSKNGSATDVSMQSRQLGDPGMANDVASQASDSSGTPTSGGPLSSGSPSTGTSSSDNGAATPTGPSAPPSDSSAGSGAPPVTVVTPPTPPKQTSTYVLTGGIALPLPRQYLSGGSVDAGVDYAAPGGTPEYAMGDGVIIGEGISGFGPNAPILKITDGPLKGMEIYYGHAGPDLVHVGEHVHAGQQITIVGYGIVGISTGPHLEVGFYPVGPMGSGSRMLSLINSIMSQHPTGRAWGPGGKVLARTARRWFMTHRLRARAMRRYAARSAYYSYTGTGGGSGEPTAQAAAVTSTAPAAVASTPPAVVTSTPPAAEPEAPAPAAAPTDSSESPAATPAPAVASGPAVDSSAASTEAPAQAGAGTEAAPTVEATAPSQPTAAPIASAPSETAGSQGADTGVSPGGVTSSTPAGSAGAGTTTDTVAAGPPASAPQSHAPSELAGPQGSTSSAGAPVSGTAAPANTAGAASTAAPSGVTATSHAGGASESGAAHGPVGSAR